MRDERKQGAYLGSSSKKSSVSTLPIPLRKLSSPPWQWKPLQLEKNSLPLCSLPKTTQTKAPFPPDFCPSNHICRDSHLPTPLLCSLPKSTPPTARRPPHAAGFSPSNNSQNDFCLIP